MKKILSISIVFTVLFACGSTIACDCTKDTNNIAETIEALTYNEDCKCEKTCNKSECDNKITDTCCKKQEKYRYKSGINQNIECASKKSCANKKLRKCNKRQLKEAGGINCTKGCPLKNIIDNIEE